MSIILELILFLSPPTFLYGMSTFVCADTHLLIWERGVGLHSVDMTGQWSPQSLSQIFCIEILFCLFVFILWPVRGGMNLLFPRGKGGVWNRFVWADITGNSSLTTCLTQMSALNSFECHNMVSPSGVCWEGFKYLKPNFLYILLEFYISQNICNCSVIKWTWLLEFISRPVHRPHVSSHIKT